MKRLTLRSVALKTVLHRKKQYVLLTVGIVLALVFSSGIIFFRASLETSLEEIKAQAYTKADFIFLSEADSFYDKLKSCSETESIGKAEGLCMLNVPGTEDRQGIFAAVFSEEAEALAYPVLEEGRLPETRGEIAIEKDALLCMGLSSACVGDEISFTVTPCDGDSFASFATEKTYTLTGILKDKRKAYKMDYSYEDFIDIFPSAVFSDSEQIEPGGKPRTVAYVKAKDPEELISAFWDEIYPSCGGAADPDSSFVVVYGGGFSGISYYMTLNTVVTVLIDKSHTARILSAVLLAASMFGIIGAFSSVLSERRKQTGLLRAVGATRRQIFSLFIREAFIICLVSVPVSVLISYFAVGLILKIIDENFLFVPDISTLVLSAAVGFVCVMAAAVVPLIRVSRSSPMQALRNTELTRKLRGKKIKSVKDFRTPVLLAKRNLSLSFLKRAGVSVLLALTVCLSCFGFAGIKNERENYYSIPFDYVIRPKADIVQFADVLNITRTGSCPALNDGDVNAILSLKPVKTVEKQKTAGLLLHVDEYTDFHKILSWCLTSELRYEMPIRQFAGDVEKHFFGKETEFYGQLKSAAGTEDELICVSLKAYSDEELKKLSDSVTDGSIDIEKIKSGEEVIVNAPAGLGLEVKMKKDGSGYWSVKPLNGDETEKEKKEYAVTGERDFSAGDELSFTMFYGDNVTDGRKYIPEGIKKAEHTVKVGAVTDAESFRRDMDLFTVITSLDAFGKFGFDMPYSSLGVVLTDDCTEETDMEMRSALDMLGAAASWHTDSQYTYKKTAQRDARSMLVTLISVITLMFTVSAGIINNDLSASIRGDKKQIGTLRAVGADINEITKSYIYRFLGVFGLGVGSGFALYFALWSLYMLLHAVTDIRFFSNPLEIRVFEALSICAALFLICALSLRVKIKRLMKDSIVDNIREL